MKNISKVFGIIVLVAVIGVFFAACSGGGDDSKPSPSPGTSGNNPFIGTWKDADLTVTCTATTWTARVSGQSWTGPYTPNGNSADFTESNGNNFGHASISGITMTVVSTYGTFYLAKQ